MSELFQDGQPTSRACAEHVPASQPGSYINRVRSLSLHADACTVLQSARVSKRRSSMDQDVASAQFTVLSSSSRTLHKSSTSAEEQSRCEVED